MANSFKHLALDWNFNSSPKLAEILGSSPAYAAKLLNEPETITVKDAAKICMVTKIPADVMACCIGKVIEEHMKGE